MTHKKKVGSLLGLCCGYITSLLKISEYSTLAHPITTLKHLFRPNFGLLSKSPGGGPAILSSFEAIANYSQKVLILGLSSDSCPPLPSKHFEKVAFKSCWSASATP
jgi:hypothetical protein